MLVMFIRGGVVFKQNSIKRSDFKTTDPPLSLSMPCPMLHRGCKMGIFSPLWFFRVFLCIYTEVSVVLIYLMLVLVRQVYGRYFFFNYCATGQ